MFVAKGELKIEITIGSDIGRQNFDILCICARLFKLHLQQKQQIPLTLTQNQVATINIISHYLDTNVFVLTIDAGVGYPDRMLTSAPALPGPRETHAADEGTLAPASENITGNKIGLGG